MIGFGGLAVLTLLLGLSFFIPVLSGKVRKSNVDRKQLNLILHEQRLKELSLEVQKEALAGLEAELDRDLLSDLKANEPEVVLGSGFKPLLIALLALPVLAFLLYSQLGRFDLLDLKVENPIERDHSIQQVIEQLGARLKENPEDIQGWLLLGRSLGATQQFDKALVAFEYALKLAPDDLDVKALYAQTLSEVNAGKMAGKPTQIVTEILSKEPNHAVGLWLAGLAAAERGDLTGAAVYWTKLKSQYPDDSEDAQQLGRYIAELKDQASKPEVAVRVRVTLAETLKSKASPDDKVFIFARAAQGPKMPLAIVQKQVKDLPIEVTLDDSMAMQQGMNLSAFDAWQLGARVSKTGNAMPNKGDLQGVKSAKAADNAQVFSIEINEEIR